MCAPLAGVALAGVIATGVAGAIGTYAKVQSDNAQAAVAEQNAQAQRNAEVEDNTAANQQALRQYMKIAQVEGQQRATAAANGVNVDYGTVGQQVSDTKLLGDMDVNQIYQQKLYTEQGHDSAIANYTAQASAAKFNAVTDGITGAASTAGSVLGGVGQYNLLKQKMGIGSFDSTSALSGVGSGLSYSNTAGMQSLASFG